MATRTKKKPGSSSSKKNNKKPASGKKNRKATTVSKSDKPAGDCVESNTQDSTLKLFREAYFATYIYYSDLSEGGRISAELEKAIREMRKDDPDGIVKSNVRDLGAWHSKDNLEKDERFAELSNHILSAAREVFIGLGYAPGSYPGISNMWANVSPRYAFNRVHTHPGAMWSGVYYVYAPENSGKIYFQDPRPQSQMYNVRYDDNKQRSRDVWSEVFYEPIVGRLILFPAWLQHEVQPNLSELEGEEGERISISFNIFQAIQNKPKQ